MQVPSIEPRQSEARPWGLAPGEMEGVRLETRDAPLAGIVIKGMLLMLVTLGIYRFWYKTNLRRYYWGNTRLMDDGFEYSGTGRELFIGFLIAIAVMMPIYLTTTIATLTMGETAGTIFGVAVSFLVIPALVQIALYRARRYRLSRTRYRGIRFSQTGTGRAYLMYSIGWMLLSVVTLGICVPHMRTALYRYRTDNTYFGNVQAHFSGEPKPLMKRWLPVWGAFIVGTFLLGVFAASAAANFGAAVLALELIAALVILAAMPFLWIVYRVAEFRYFTSNTYFGEIRLASDLRARPVVFVMVKFALALLVLTVTLGLFVALTAGVFRSALSGDSIMAAFQIVGFLYTLGSLLLYALLTELYLRVRLWRLYVGSVAIANTAALQKILQQDGQNESGFGEAFDSGFEIAG